MTRSQLQYNLPHRCNRVVLMDQGICFFPVHERGEEEEEEEVEENEREGGGGERG